MKIEKYSLFEVVVEGVKGAGLVEYCAVFTNGSREIHTFAFRDEGARYVVRFMPENTGRWDYVITLGGNETKGNFECVENTGNNHGPVFAREDYFCYADGKMFIPVGTTCYAWLHQTEELQRQTIETLASSPFNKIRMCVFPKSMPYNHNDPECYPFLKNNNGEWDVTRPDSRFWHKLDVRLKALMDIGVEADLIVFHPYDRWGFSELSQEQSMIYLEYCIARLSAYRNLWWSLANEYETVYAKSISDWDAYGELLKTRDIYGHLISIHNIIAPYPKRDWMTHCSIQSKDIDHLIIWKQQYGMPVLIDECGYEGDLAFDWGSLTGFEMVHRFWQTVCRGGFCTHGETFHKEDEVLWWAKGGRLYGESPKRLAFMKEILYQLPSPWHTAKTVVQNPNETKDAKQEAQEKLFQKALDCAPSYDREKFTANTSPMLICGEGYFLQYLGRIRPVYTELFLEEGKNYRVEIIDIWEMSKIIAAEGVSGKVKIDLPAKEGIAILSTEI